MGEKKSWLAALVAWVLLLGIAAVAPAATWTVIENKDCTAASVATSTAGDASSQVRCCTGASNGFCSRREAGGALFTYNIAMVADGNYANNGDPLVAAQLAKIPLDTIVDWKCDTVVTNGASPPTVVETPIVRRTDARKGTTILIFVPSTGIQHAVAAIDGFTLNCLVTGY